MDFHEGIIASSCFIFPIVTIPHGQQENPDRFITIHSSSSCRFNQYKHYTQANVCYIDKKNSLTMTSQNESNSESSRVTKSGVTNGQHLKRAVISIVGMSTAVLVSLVSPFIPYSTGSGSKRSCADIATQYVTAAATTSNDQEFVDDVVVSEAAASAPSFGNWFQERPFKTEKPQEKSLGIPVPLKSSSKRQTTSFVTAAVRAVGPAVVRIDTERTVTNTGLDPLFEDPLFKKFFGDDLQKQIPKERTERGQGSGFIISRDGLVVTNAHVVKDAEKVTVTLTDGRSFTGIVKGTDDLLDLAAVKIEGNGTDLPVAPLGMSDDLQVGDWVIAVGNPLGLDNTVTLGIVSALNRSAAEVGIPEKRLNFIQTDAAINPGNSGGTLVNEFGEVVGINTAIRANAEAIGFAIPIDRAKSIIGELAKGKKIQHSFLGIQMVSLTPEFAKQNNEDPNAPAVIPEIDGAIVVKVLPNSPAAQAGVRRFDIIQSIDGFNIKTAKEVQAFIDKTKVGQVVNMKIVRGNRPIELPVKAGDLNEVKDTESGKKNKDTFPPALP